MLGGHHGCGSATLALSHAMLVFCCAGLPVVVIMTALFVVPIARAWEACTVSPSSVPSAPARACVSLPMNEKGCMMCAVCAVYVY